MRPQTPSRPVPALRTPLLRLVAHTLPIIPHLGQFKLRNGSTVLYLVSPAVLSPNHVVVIPASHLRDFLMAERADAFLSRPKVEQFPSSFQVTDHFEAEALSVVRHPSGVVGVGFCLYFDVPTNRCLRCSIELDGALVLRLAQSFSNEDQRLAWVSAEVFLLDPSGWFLGMSSLRPMSYRHEDCMVHFAESRFTHYVLVIVGPSPNHRIQLHDELTSRTRWTFANAFPDLC